MSASLSDYPSISRLIAELNGDRPGTSLFDIVKRDCCWNALPAKPHEGATRKTLQFGGGSGDEIIATYTAKSTTSPNLRRQIPEEDSLRISWRETKTQRFEILCESGPGLGVTFVRAFVVRDNARFPVWGDPHPSKIGNTYWRMIEERSLWNSPDEETAIKAQRYEQIFAARMLLATSIDWPKELLSSAFAKSPKEVGLRLGLLTESLNTEW